MRNVFAATVVGKVGWAFFPDDTSFLKVLSLLFLPIYSPVTYGDP